MAVKQEIDTDIYPVNDENFTNTGSCLQYRYNGRTSFRRLYNVEPSAYKWDLGADFIVPDGWTMMATGSRFGQYCYILIKKVGRAPFKVQGGCEYGIRHRFCFVQEWQEGDITLKTADVGTVVNNYWDR